jgi:hypothetical protein
VNRSWTRRSVLTGFAVMVVAGCSASVGGPPEPTSSKVTQALASGHVEFDLTKPPSRAEAGMLDGSDSVSYENKKKPIQVQIRLPENKALNAPARLVTFDSISTTDSKTSPPTGMDLDSYPATLQAGRDQALADAKRFGFDADQINRWYTDATTAKATLRSLWLTSKVGYLTVQLQLTYTPQVKDIADSAQTNLHYLLTWK